MASCHEHKLTKEAKKNRLTTNFPKMNPSKRSLTILPDSKITGIVQLVKIQGRSHLKTLNVLTISQLVLKSLMPDFPEKLKL